MEEINSQESSLKERYELIIKARNFHYDNFSKWMTYFYVSISALFIAFYTIASKKNEEIEDKFLLEIALLLLGYIISLLWYWSSKGYYYWSINFINIVNHYEEKVFKWKPRNRVYKVFYDKTLQNDYSSPISGANISTSKIAILFAYLNTLFWGFLLFYKIIKPFSSCIVISIIASFLFSYFTIRISSNIFPKHFLYSNIDELPEIKNEL